MQAGYTYIWKYLVPPDSARAFERAYGPKGAWVKLFKKHDGYLRTELHKDAVSERNEQFVIDDQGKKTGVLLPVEEYERLMADLHDLAVVAERRDGNNVPFEEIKDRSKVDDLL